MTRNSSLWHVLCIGTLSAILMTAGVLVAQEESKNGTADEPGMVAGAFASGSRAADERPKVSDPAFNHLIDLDLLGRAWRELDASLMADVALQFVAAEHILRREHEAISTDDLLNVAVRMAAQEDSAGTLDRLAVVAKERGDDQLQEQVEQAQKLAGQSRRPAPRITGSVDQLRPAEYATLYDFLQAVKRAQITGDWSEVDKLQPPAAFSSLTEERRRYLKKVMGKSRTAQADESPQISLSTAQALRSLASDTRGWGLSDLDPFNKNSGVRKSLRTADQKRLDAIQGRRFTVTIRNPTHSSIHYALNGTPEFLLPGYKNTHRGRGTAEIHFHPGFGTGRKYYNNLSDGTTYYFTWNKESVPTYGRISVLDLYRQR